MQIQYDSLKREANLAKHGRDFTLFPDLWRGLVYQERDRRFVERRWNAYGLVNGRLHVAAYTRRRGIYRVISLRKANDREKAYVKNQSSKRR